MLLVFGYERLSLSVALHVNEFVHFFLQAKTELAVLCDQEGAWRGVPTATRICLLSVVSVFARTACVSTRSIELLLPCCGPSGFLEKVDLGSIFRPVLDRANGASLLLPQPGILRSLRRPIVGRVWH